MVIPGSKEVVGSSKFLDISESHRTVYFTTKARKVMDEKRETLNRELSRFNQPS